MSEIMGVMLSAWLGMWQTLNKWLTLVLLPLLISSHPLCQTPGPTPELTGRQGLLPATLDLVFLLCGIPAFKEALPEEKGEVSGGEKPLH